MRKFFKNVDFDFWGNQNTFVKFFPRFISLYDVNADWPSLTYHQLALFNRKLNKNEGKCNKYYILYAKIIDIVRKCNCCWPYCFPKSKFMGISSNQYLNEFHSYKIIIEFILTYIWYILCTNPRYSHQSTRKLVRDSRSAQGSSRGSRGGYRSQPSPSSTEETAEETTETDSQVERNPDYPHYQQPYM